MQKTNYKDLIRIAVRNGQQSTKGWMRTNCPMCIVRTGKEDRRWSMGFLPEKGIYSCFRCGTRGKLSDDFTDLIFEHEEVEELEFVDKPEGFMPLWEGPAASSRLTRDAREYLIGRNVDESIWEACQVGICLNGEFNSRIVVPVTKKGEWQGYVGRVWDEEGVFLKYKNCEGMRRGNMLWNQDALHIKTDDPIIVVEGLFDGLPHYPDTVACLGKPSHEQLPILLSAKRPIVAALDGDAWYEGEALSMRLQVEGKKSAFVRLPPKTDPGNLLPGELKTMAINELKKNY